MDIDQLSEPELVRLYQSALSDRTGEVNGALNMGNHKGALAASLKKPPLGVSDQALLVRLVLQHHTTPHDTTRHHRWPPAALARSLSIYARYRSSSLSYRYPILYMECSPPASEHLLLLSLACSPQSPSIDSACCVGVVAVVAVAVVGSTLTERQSNAALRVSFNVACACRMSRRSWWCR
mgnify:CR=1 FL=1